MHVYMYNRVTIKKPPLRFKLKFVSPVAIVIKTPCEKFQLVWKNLKRGYFWFSENKHNVNCIVPKNATLKVFSLKLFFIWQLSQKHIVENLRRFEQNFWKVFFNNFLIILIVLRFFEKIINVLMKLSSNHLKFPTMCICYNCHM